MMKPDHTAIARFRQENGKAVEELFAEALKLCAKAGLVKIGLAAELTMEENDVKQLIPMIEKAVENMAALEINDETIGVVLADAGYCSDTNMDNERPEGPEYIIATKKDWKQRQELRETEPPRGRIPEKLTLKERMQRKLLTKRGRELYKKRGQIV